MPKDDVEFSTNAPETEQRLGFYRRRESGKLIRRRIERHFDAVLGQVASGDPQTVRQMPHARWLLDNSHLVRQALQQIETDLPSAYHRQLPTVVAPNGRKTPRIFALIDEAIDQSEYGGAAAPRHLWNFYASLGAIVRAGILAWRIPTSTGGERSKRQAIDYLNDARHYIALSHPF